MTVMEFWTEFWQKSLPRPTFAPSADGGPPPTAWPVANPWQAWSEYWIDACQRTVLFWDVMRRRGNAFLEHEKNGKPPVLSFQSEIVMDGRSLPKPVNYYLLRIVPPAGTTVDPTRRAFVVIDPRAGHGPGIGGSKIDSEIGVAMRAGHPCYFVGFRAEPEPGQT